MRGITALLTRLVRSVFRIGINRRATDSVAKLSSGAAESECDPLGWSSRESRIRKKPDWHDSFTPQTYRDEYRGDFDGGY